MLFYKLYFSFIQNLHLNISCFTTSLGIFFLHLHQFDVVFFFKEFVSDYFFVWLNFISSALFIHPYCLWGL